MRIPLAYITMALLGTEAIKADNFAATVDYLYWNASQNDMNYALVYDDIDTLANGVAKYQRSDWASGVRIGIGYQLPCSWDTCFSWTRFHNSVKGKASSEFIIASQLLKPNGGLIVGGSAAEGSGPAKSAWNLNFDKFDLDFGYTLYNNDCYQFQPSVGIRGLIVTQNQHISYENFIDTSTGGNVNATVIQKNDFWGIGPGIGMNNTFKIGYGLSLVGNFSFSAFYGRLPSKTSTLIIETESDGNSSLGSSLGGESFGSFGHFRGAAALGDEIVTPTAFKLNRTKLIPSFQLFFGIEWSTVFGYCYPFSLAVGYETQYFWGLWRIQNSQIQSYFITSVDYSALELSGITARVSFGF